MGLRAESIIKLGIFAAAFVAWASSAVAQTSQPDSTVLAKEYVFPRLLPDVYENPSPESDSLRLLASPKYAVFGRESDLFSADQRRVERTGANRTVLRHSWSGPVCAIAALVEMRKAGTSVKAVDRGRYLCCMSGEHCMSDDGKTIAAIGSYDKNGETHIWIGTGEQWHKYMDEIGSKIPRSLGVPNTPIDSGHFGGTVIRVPDLEPDPLDPHRRKHQTLWNDIALSADGSRLVYHAAANRVPSLIHRAELKLFDTRTGKLISQMDTGIDGRRVPCFRCLTLNRDGSRLFAHCMPKDAPAYNTIYETAKYESVGRWRGEPSFARFSPDGRWLVTNINGYVCLNDCENGRIRQLYAADAQQPSQFTVNSRSVRIVSDIEPGELTRNVRVLEYDLDSGDLARTVSFAGASPQCGPVLLGSYGRYLSALFGYSVGSKQPRHVMGLVWAVDDEPTQVADKVSVSRLWKVKGRSVEAEFVALLPMPAGLQEGYMVRLRTPKDEVINLPYAGLEVSSQKAAYLLYSVFGNGS